MVAPLPVYIINAYIAGKSLTRSASNDLALHQPNKSCTCP
jgi:hypothetical protein